MAELLELCGVRAREREREKWRAKKWSSSPGWKNCLQFRCLSILQLLLLLQFEVPLGCISTRMHRRAMVIILVYAITAVNGKLLGRMNERDRDRKKWKVFECGHRERGWVQQTRNVDWGSHISKQTSRLAKICGCPIGTNLTIHCIMFAFKMSTFLLQLSYLYCLEAFSRRLFKFTGIHSIQNGLVESGKKKNITNQVENFKISKILHVDRNSTVY